MIGLRTKQHLKILSKASLNPSSKQLDKSGGIIVLDKNELRIGSEDQGSQVRLPSSKFASPYSPHSSSPQSSYKELLKLLMGKWNSEEEVTGKDPLEDSFNSSNF